MYRTEYRRLGCIGWVLVAVVAGSLGAPLLMAPFALLFGSAQVGPYAPLFWVVAMLLMRAALYRDLRARRAAGLDADGGERESKPGSSDKGMPLGQPTTGQLEPEADEQRADAAGGGGR